MQACIHSSIHLSIITLHALIIIIMLYTCISFSNRFPNMALDDKLIYKHITLYSHRVLNWKFSISAKLKLIVRNYSPPSTYWNFTKVFEISCLFHFLNIFGEFENAVTYSNSQMAGKRTSHYSTLMFGDFNNIFLNLVSSFTLVTIGLSVYPGSMDLPPYDPTNLSGNMGQWTLMWPYTINLESVDSWSYTNLLINLGSADSHVAQTWISGLHLVQIMFIA